MANLPKSRALNTTASFIFFFFLFLVLIKTSCSSNAYGKGNIIFNIMEITTTTVRGGIRYPEEITTSTTTTTPKLPIMLEKYKAIDEQLTSIIIVATVVTLFINRKKIEDHIKKKRKERKLKERKDRDSNLTPSIKLRKVINSNRVSIKHLSNNIKLKLKKRGYR